MATYLTPRQLAARWERSVSHVNKLARTGQIAALRSGKGWRFSLAAVESFEAANTTGSVSAPSTEAAKQEPSRSKEVKRPATSAAAGFTLSADYIPCFPALWPGHEPRTKKPALNSH